MSETVLDTNASVSTDVRPEVATLALLVEKVPDGTDATGAEKHKIEFTVLTKSKDIEEARAKDPESIVIEQTFGYTKPTTVAGLSQIGLDDDEIVIIFNAGLKQRFMSKAGQLIKELDAEGNLEFQPVVGTYDMQEELNKPLQRRNLSPTDKLAKALKGIIPDDKIAEFIAQAMAQAAK